MKRLLIIVAVVAALVGISVAPAFAANESSLSAAVTVNEVVSITLTDAGITGIYFGEVTPPVTGQGDEDQSSGTPAVRVTVDAGTNVNVDVGIKGAITGTLALTNWKYSTTFAGTKTSLPVAYAAIYTNVAAGSPNDVYHWIDVPAGTAAGIQGCNIFYKAVKTGTSF